MASEWKPFSLAPHLLFHLRGNQLRNLLLEFLKTDRHDDVGLRAGSHHLLFRELLTLNCGMVDCRAGKLEIESKSLSNIWHRLVYTKTSVRSAAVDFRYVRCS